MTKYNFDKVLQNGKWEISIDTQAQYGCTQDDNGDFDIGLWFENNSLTDYDGCYELPKKVIEGIELMGFNADYAKITVE
jgi:hypothetical protein